MSSVKRHYAEVAQEVLDALEPDAVVGCSSCCEVPATRGEAFALYAQEALEGLPAGAQAASRGCGDPIGMADIQPGMRILDLGSGGGIDALIAAKLVGEHGHVYGVDMTDEMVTLARQNAEAAGAANVEFIHSTIQDISLPDGSVDVIISNCVINLCDRKADVFAEAHRLLAPGGKLVVSDIVAFAPVPVAADAPLRRITGCTNGISTQEEYQHLLEQAGFAEVSIQPKTLYTLEVLHEKAHRKDRLDSYELIKGMTQVDRATGSAIITASVR